MSGGNAVLTMSRLSKSYGSAIAVDRADLSLYRGRILCLLGPSGCGKSSLLRLIAGLEQADEGEVSAGDRLLTAPGIFVPPEQREIGLVFQDLALFPHLTAAQNVAFGLPRQPSSRRKQLALELLDRFGLAHRADAFPHVLSGGEQQRIAIARALAPRPLALLLDEPFSGLDGELRAQVRESVAEGLRETGAAILIVTHDPEEAMLLGDEIALMAGGRIVQTGTPAECYSRPVSASAAKLLGRVNVVPALAEAGFARCRLGSFPATGIKDGAAFVLVRPEELECESSGKDWLVSDVRFGGSFFEAVLSAGGERLVMRSSSGPPPAPGDTTGIAIVGTQPWIISAAQDGQA